MKKNEVGEGLLLLLLSGFFMKEALKVHKGNWALSPALFPLIVTGVSFLLALLLIYGGVKNKEDDPKEKADKRQVLFILGLSLLYLIFLNFLGFISISIIYLAIFMMVLGERRWWVLASLSIIGPLFIYYIFANLLDVFLP